MMTVFDLALEARDESRNIARSYSLRVGRDLFGTWVMELQHGRRGTRGRLRLLAFGDEAEVRREVRRRLKRRASAPKRIGVGYRTINVDGAAWLAGEPAFETVKVKPKNQQDRVQAHGKP